MAIFNTVYGGEPKWKPGSNTIAYYPLTSTTTTSDMKWSGTAYNLTNSGNVTFWTYNWVSCAYFNGTTNWYLYNTSLSFSYPSEQTVCVWMYISGTSSWVYQAIYHIWIVGWTWKLGSWFRYGTWLSLSGWTGSSEVIKSWNINWAWHLLANITNWNSSIQYLDWVQYQSNTNSLSATQSGIYLWGAQNTSSDRLTWYESELIVENKARTSDKVMAYYNQTKSNYGL